MPVRIRPVGTSYESDVIEAYGYIYAQRRRYNIFNGLKGALVVAVNSSFGINYGDPSVHYMWCDMYEELGSVGILSCVAGPNSRPGVPAINVETLGDIPTRCTSDYLVGVTSSDMNDNKYSLAGFGNTSIDLAAPGVNIISTTDNNTYGVDTGTSFATPHVTGTISLMYAAACADLMELYKDYPAAVALQMKHFLLSGADQLSSLTTYVAEGRRLNALGAIEYVRGVQTAALEATTTIDANSGNVTWADEKVVFGNILVKTGYTLTVEDGLLLPKSGKITVERGAKLVVDGGRITTASPDCIGFWQGIEVIGNPYIAQTAANQGTVELKNGAIIEYANEAIYTGVNGNGWQGGAIIEASNTTFRNNRRAVAFLQYTQSDNLSYFTDGTFELNEDYPQSTYIDMLTMWDVKGVDFTDCVFRNTNPSVSNEKRGIYALDAGFDISGSNSSFSGFEGGIMMTNSNTVNTFTVDEADFADNAVGIYAGSVDNISVTSNNFTVGQYNTSTYNHGLFVEESTGYQVEENNFTGDDQVTGGMDLIGVECQNAGDDYNQIYNNDFSDLYYGAKAYGDNRNSNPYLPTGLIFICNNHTDNTYDFRVDKDNSISASLSGIAPVQGIYFQSAGNTFSLNTTPTGSDYYNDTPNSIFYYYDNGTGRKPLNTYNLTLPSFAANAHGCSSQLFMMMASSGSMEQQYYDNQTAYNTALKTYQEKIDGGQTESLLNDVEFADSRSAQELYETLIGLSPWLSTSVLQKVLDQAELFTYEQVSNLLLSNPTLIKADRLWERLAKQIESDQIAILKAEMTQRPANERSEMEETLAQHFTEMQIASSALIQNAISSESTDLLTARNWLDKKGTLKANYAIVESWLQEKQADQALAALGQIPSRVQLEAHQALGYQDYQALTQLKVNAMKSERTIADFSKEEVSQLVQIANRNNGRAGVQARGILNFFYGYEYVSEQSSSTTPNEAQNSLLKLRANPATSPVDQTLIRAFPNPANEMISFSYNLTDYPDARIILQIFDESGRSVKELVLDPIVGETRWNTSQLETGLYIYQLKTASNIISSGQFLIAR